MDRKFQYLDEEDKSYGITGMVISLNVFDRPSVLSRISIEDSDESMEFTPDFFFCGNPGISAKLAWNEIIKQYQLLTGMVIGNIMCRYYVHRRKGIDRDTRLAIRALVDDEGREACNLDADEIDVLFDKTFGYLDSVYRDPRLASLARDFAVTLRQRRVMTGSDISDEFRN